MSKAYIRNQPDGRWNTEAIVGADRLFIGTTALKQTQIMRFGLGVSIFVMTLPIVLSGVYLGVMGESVALGWKIALPSMFVVFVFLDRGHIVVIGRASKYSYWTGTVLSPKKTQDSVTSSLVVDAETNASAASTKV